MAGTDKDIVVGLDIGTSGIAIAVLENGCGAKQEPLGFGYSPSIGIEKGCILDMESAVSAVKSAFAGVEVLKGVNTGSVYASVDMPGMVAGRGKSRLQFPGKRRITRRDLHEARQQLYQSVLPAGYAVVQVTGVQFFIDAGPVSMPVGCKGRELGMEATVVAAPGEQVEQVRRCLRSAGLRAIQTVAGPVAVTRAVLAGVEQELGVVCVDIGAGMTKAIYINYGRPEHMCIFPVGSGHITADLAVGLHTGMEEAESIKCRYGLDPIVGHINVQNLAGKNLHTVPGELVHRIIRSRVEEILDLVNQFIRQLRLAPSLPGGVVITGGGSRLAGLSELAKEWWDMPVRRGIPRAVPEKGRDDETYRYTTAIGLAMWGAGQRPGTRMPKRSMEGGIVGRFKSWLR